MPIIKSAIKRMRQNGKRRLINRSRLGQMRTAVKQLKQLVNDGNTDQAKAHLPRVYSMIDRSAQKGVIHRNAAARYKSRLTAMVEASTAS